MLSNIFGSTRRANDRRTGNQCRDARDWPGAANAYKRHLASNPSDQPIWVQLGHAWKEEGMLAEAAEAYQTAVDLNIDDGDANIHLADALRRLGRGDEALAAYERVNAIAPNVESIEQIRLLRRDTEATAAIGLGDGTTFFSIQDLFGYLKAHVTMSGIQRVQAGIAMHAIRDAAIDVRFILSNVGPNTQPLPAGEFWMVDNAQLLRIIDYASGKHVSHETLRAMLMACEDAAERVRPLQGSTVILLGAFWGLGNSVKNFVPAKRDGVRIGAYVYDIIPVTHPEFCDDALVTDFTMAICELCAVADFVLTISDATQIALAEFIAKNGGRPIPMATVPLAHHLTRETDHTVAWPEQLSRVKGKRYVAYVSTIEGRKNHLYVINAWRRLIAEGIDVPDLVFVGRHGWKIGALTDVLTATNNLGGRLHIAHNLSDGELNTVYAGCAFSVFTSFVEGWGLPVGESLYQGRPCVASNTSSVPEVGGNMVDYIDPFNLTQGIDVFRRMITDRKYLENRADNIRQHFVGRTWKDVGVDFLAKVKTFQDVPIAALALALREGENCAFKPHAGDRINVYRYFGRVSRLLLQSSDTYEAETQGIWLRGARPEIAVPTDMAPGTTVFAYIRLSSAPWTSGCRMTVMDQVADAETVSISLNGAHDQSIRFPTQIDRDGLFRLQLIISGSYVPPAGETRNCAIGIGSIGYARPDNINARQELLETMMLQDLSA
jgi:glycosyltransferase involved in cell wall biosynthesis